MMKTCPRCDRQEPDRANRCSWCGEWLAESRPSLGAAAEPATDRPVARERDARGGDQSGSSASGRQDDRGPTEPGASLPEPASPASSPLTDDETLRELEALLAEAPGRECDAPRPSIDEDGAAGNEEPESDLVQRARSLADALSREEEAVRRRDGAGHAGSQDRGPGRDLPLDVASEVDDPGDLFARTLAEIADLELRLASGAEAAQQESELDLPGPSPDGSRIDRSRRGAGSPRVLIGKVLGKVLITRKLGSGALADHYMGLEVGASRTVTVKVLPPALACEPDLVSRFMAEIETTRLLEHPNVLTVCGWGDQDGYLYLTRKYLTADSLESRLAGPERPTRRRALKIATDVLEGLAYCHANGIVHGDLGPASIRFDLEQRAVVAGGALSGARIGGSGPGRRATLQELRHLSPEQIRGDRAVDARSDLYQVGLILFEMLVGWHPGPAGVRFAATVPGKTGLAPQAFVPDLPRYLSGIVARALARDPGDRHESASKMLEELTLLSTGRE
ncbi:MAG: protein kinase [Candidatus Riflebacteria bacterium]|nr:protein kinase [Candidatus Riflebacteria bacterium]